MSAINLDHAAATSEQAIVTAHCAEAKDLNRFVTKALGVFQDDGVFAGFLFLASRADKKEAAFAATIRDRLLELIGNKIKPQGGAFAGTDRSWQAVSTYLTKDPGLLTDLDTLFLTKSVIEQTLIYARYGAKAADIENGG